MTTKATCDGKVTLSVSSNGSLPFHDETFECPLGMGHNDSCEALINEGKCGCKVYCYFAKKNPAQRQYLTQSCSEHGKIAFNLRDIPKE